MWVSSVLYPLSGNDFYFYNYCYNDSEELAFTIRQSFVGDDEQWDILLLGRQGLDRLETLPAVGVDFSDTAGGEIRLSSASDRLEFSVLSAANTREARLYIDSNASLNFQCLAAALPTEVAD